MPFFQAIAKLNLPHKLIGLHLKREGGQGEGENDEREQRREKAKDKTITNRQTKRRNLDLRDLLRSFLNPVMFFPATHRSHLETFAERTNLVALPLTH